MTEIQWTLYPYVAELEYAKAWLGIQKKLLRAPKTIDAYARGLNDFLSICRRFAIRVATATKGDIASYVEEMACLDRRLVAPCTGTGQLVWRTRRCNSVSRRSVCSMTT